MKLTGNRASLGAQASGEAPQLYQELWISFVSLLRAYAAAASIGLPENGIRIVDRDGCGLKLCTASKTLVLDFDAQSGSGQWRSDSLDGKTAASAGYFAIDQNGRVSLNGNASGIFMEMDAAAEALTAKIL